MSIGKMRHVISVSKPTFSVNDGGTPTQSLLPFATLRAEKLTLERTETVGDAGAADREVIRLRTRYVDKLRADMIIGFGSDSFNIKAIRVIGNNRFLEIDAQKVGG